MKIIAISGWKGSGKDTLAGYLMERFDFKRLAFADPLKDMVSEEYGIERSHCDDVNFKEKPILTLPVLIKDGFSRHLANFLIREFRFANGLPVSTEQLNVITNTTSRNSPVEDINAEFGQLYWTPRALCILKGSVNRTVTSSYWVERAAKVASKNPNGLYVISDLRFKSEATQLAEFAGKENVTFIRVERFDSSPSTDPSERDMDDFKFDHYISNRGSKEEAFQALEKALGLRG